MRPFASALSLNRGGRSDNASTSSQSTPVPAPRLAKSRSTTLFAKAPKTPVETTGPVPRSRPELTPGSSCSSDGSGSLRTPEDEGLMTFPKLEEKKRWSAWFGWRKISDKRIVEEPVDLDRPLPHVVSTGRKFTTGPSIRVSQHSTSDTDDDSDSDSESSAYHEGGTSAISTRPSHATIFQARTNLRTLLRNSLFPLPSPPPLVDIPTARFPRSCASIGGTQFTPSLETAIHARKFLKRLDRHELSRMEVQSIANLSHRPQAKAASRNGTEKRPDDDAMSYASMRVGRFSQGLRKWTSRPCFEQRFVVWQPNDNGDVICKNVMGVERGLAVCDLEFSEGAEALAGLMLDDQTFERNLFPPPPTPKGVAIKPIPRKLSPPRGSPRKASFKISPSPLRLDHATLAEPVLTPVSSLSSVALSVLAPTSRIDVNRPEASRRASVAGVPPVSREDDEDVPLGYAVLAKKRREEKEKFLQAEREKREKEAATREAAEKQKRYHAEQRRAVEEQKRAEEERKRVEDERKAREERNKAKYAEEVAASRRRRENARLGMDNSMNIREMHQRGNGPTFSRPAYDSTPPPALAPRRSASAFVIPTEAPSRDSAGTLKPTSFPESQLDKRHSVAPYANSSGHSSVDDLRSQTHRRQSSGTDRSQQQGQHNRPPSVVSNSSKRASFLRTQSAPNQVQLMPYAMMPAIPPIPPMPVWTMPLLPPNAPFMMQQFSRSPSPGSNNRSYNSSPSPSPTNRQSVAHTPPSPSRSPHEPGSSPKPRHSRYPSGDGRVPQASTQSRSSPGTSHRSSRSPSYSPLQSSPSQPLTRDDISRKSHNGSSKNLTHMDTKRRTTMM